MKKGFTLIELLAVIAILALLVVLAVPKVLKLFEEAKKNTFKIEAQNIVKAAEQGYALQLLNGSIEETTITYIEGEATKTGNIPLNLSGRNIQNGTIKITKEGEIALAIVNGKYCAKKDFDTELTITEDIEACNLTKGVVSIAAGAIHTMFLMNDGSVKAVGDNEFSQLGDGTSTNSSTPVSVVGLTGVKQVAAGEDHTVFLMNDGSVKAIGLNDNGQLGNGTTTNSSTLINVILND